MSYKLGSLFDGSGGFPLAGSLCDIKPVWASEVEPYPIAVTKSRFPKMKHLGDISKINGADIDPVDIITFGSPCQDLSVAGKRAGLKHEANGDEETTRSGLFMEAVRIIKEMREKTNGKYPRFAVWENVPGAFSSNKGEDFRVVLEELIKVAEPSAVMPEVPPKGWAYADCYSGDGWSLAYRVLDAQYWGVPQRRRRIYLVADFRGECAKEILFERDGLRGYFTQGRTPWQTAPADAQGSTGTDDREGGNRVIAKESYTSVVVEPTVCLEGNGQRPSHRGNGYAEADKSYTLNATEVHGVAYGFDPGASRDVGNLFIEETGKTLTNGTCPGHHDGVVIALDREAYNSGKNFARSPGIYDDGTNPTLVARGPSAVCLETFHLTTEDDKTQTLKARDYKDPLTVVFGKKTRYIVRRLTPTECARLQGFADRHGDIEKKTNFTTDEYSFWLEVRNTHAAINGKKTQYYTKAQMLTWYNKLQTDSSEYKMWGNGIALPTALYVLQGIEDALSWADYEA